MKRHCCSIVCLSSSLSTTHLTENKRLKIGASEQQANRSILHIFVLFFSQCQATWQQVGGDEEQKSAQRSLVNLVLCNKLGKLHAP